MVYIIAFCLWLFLLAVIKIKRINENLIFQVPLVISLFIPTFLFTNHQKLADAAAIVFLILITESIVYKIVQK